MIIGWVVANFSLWAGLLLAALALGAELLSLVQRRRMLATIEATQTHFVALSAHNVDNEDLVGAVNGKDRTRVCKR
jgi:hypothetical protein